MTKSELEHPLLKEIPRLQGCLLNDRDQVQFGDSGDFVFAIQMALMTIDHAEIEPTELQAQSFRGSTRAGVLAYKRARKIVTVDEERRIDATVGKMTIERLDDDLLGRKHPTNPLTDPDEPSRIGAVLTRERPAVPRIIDRSIAILEQLRDAIRLANEEPGKLLQFEAANPLVMDALRRFCGMGVRPDAGLVGELLEQYQAFRAKAPNLARDQKPIDFTDFVKNFPANINPSPNGPNFPPAISNSGKAMFFTPRYRDLDASAQPLFQGMIPPVLELIQLHEMGHFYFGFDDGDPRGRPFFVSRRFAQTYEFFSRQAVFRISAA